jgi:hypothetical protein
MVNGIGMLMNRSWPPGVEQVIRRAKARDSVLLLVASLFVVGMLTNGMRLYPLLPDEVPARALSLSALPRSPIGVLSVPKTVTTVYGQTAIGLFVLLVYWMSIRLNLMSGGLASLRSQFMQLRSEHLAALEVCCFNDLFSWLAFCIAMLLALDAQRMWYSALGRSSSLISALLNLVGPIAVSGFLLSLAFTWYRLRMVSTRE